MRNNELVFSRGMHTHAVWADDPNAPATKMLYDKADPKRFFGRVAQVPVDIPWLGLFHDEHRYGIAVVNFANHHTARDIDTPEFRVIWDADHIINIPEDYPHLSAKHLEAKIAEARAAKTIQDELADIGARLQSSAGGNDSAQRVPWASARNPKPSKSVLPVVARSIGCAEINNMLDDGITFVCIRTSYSSCCNVPSSSQVCSY